MPKEERRSTLLAFRVRADEAKRIEVSGTGQRRWRRQFVCDRALGFVDGFAQKADVFVCALDVSEPDAGDVRHCGVSYPSGCESNIFLTFPDSSARVYGLPINDTPPSASARRSAALSV